MSQTLTMTLEKAIIVPGLGASTFVWQQTSALITWTIPHNTGRYPSVTVVDGTGAKIEADVLYVDNNIVQVTFGAAFAGSAYLN